MGKTLKLQARGKGSPTYRAHSFKWVTEVKHRKYDDIEKSGVLQGKVIELVDCPGHTAPLAKIKYDNNEISYIFAPIGLKVNDTVATGPNAPTKIGNTLPLKNIPEGTEVYNIENKPADRGRFARAAGSFGKVIQSLDSEVLIKLPSKKQKLFNPNCRATIGVIAGGGRLEKPFVKAGKMHHAMRARGKLYPVTSGVAMNAVDHPFGSGRGRHVGRAKTVSRFAPPGAKVGKVSARRTGRRKR